MKRTTEESEEAPPAKRPKMDSSFVESFFARDKGKKTYLEDRILCIPDLASLDDCFSEGKYALFCVFDGHGGHWVANQLQSFFPQTLIAHLKEDLPHKHSDKSQRNSLVKKALISTFLKCDEAILKMQRAHNLNDGSTACVCFIEGSTLWTANIGDTKAILAVKKNDSVKGVSLSKDHTADKESEQTRIAKTTGFVQNNRVLGILEVTRSFGDPSFKKNGVICVPHVSKVPISKKIEYVLMGTDGLFSVWNVKEITKFISDAMNHPAKPELKQLTRQILEETILHRNCTDNVSTLIMKFKHDS